MFATIFDALDYKRLTLKNGTRSYRIKLNLPESKGKCTVQSLFDKCKDLSAKNLPITLMVQLNKTKSSGELDLSTEINLKECCESKKDLYYKLVGVIKRDDNNNYISYVKQKGQWYKLENAIKAKELSVKKLKEELTKGAYILRYEEFAEYEKQFKTLRKPTQVQRDEWNKIYNTEKDRYSDIYALAQNNEGRRKQKDPYRYETKGEKTLNASKVLNKVDAQSNDKFSVIATQAPIQSSFGDFLDLLYTSDKLSGVVVLGPADNVWTGSNRIPAYFSSEFTDSTTKYGDYKIGRSKSDQTYKVNGGIGDKYLMKIKGKTGEKSKPVYHFSTWKDRAVPDNVEEFINFVSQFKDSRKLVVHCSAGIGRTGVFTSYLYALRTGITNPIKIVNDIRQYRVDMVQTSAQYNFLCYLCQRLEGSIKKDEKFDETKNYALEKWSQEGTDIPPQQKVATKHEDKKDVKYDGYAFKEVPITVEIDKPIKMEISEDLKQKIADVKEMLSSEKQELDDLKEIYETIKQKRKEIADRYDRLYYPDREDRVEDYEIDEVVIENLGDWAYIEKNSSKLENLAEIQESFDIKTSAWNKVKKYFTMPRQPVKSQQSWSFDSKKKTLSITKNDESDTFWENIYKSIPFWDVENIVFKEEVTEIPENFYAINFISLKTVKGDNVNKIGAHAFDSSCVESVDFPKVQKIDRQAFYNCKKLGLVVIPIYAKCDVTAFKGVSYEMKSRLYNEKGEKITPQFMKTAPKLLIAVNDKVDEVIRQLETEYKKIKNERESRSFNAKVMQDAPRVAISLGEYYLSQGRVKEAIPVLIEAFRYNTVSKKGSTRAAVLLGDCFRKGCDGVISQNLNMAISLYQRAARFRDTEAMVRLGDIYRAIDKAKAKEYYEGAWKQKDVKGAWKLEDAGGEWGQKDVNALVKLLDYYPEEYTEEKVFTEMTELLTTEGYYENPDLNFHLGVFYQFGFGTKPDVKKAVECYKEAAKQGHIKAMNKLGEYHYNESFRQPNKELRINDLKKSQDWWKHAKARGSTQATSNLYRIQVEISALKNEEIMPPTVKPSLEESTSLTDTVEILNKTIDLSSFVQDDHSDIILYDDEISYDDILSRETGGLLVVPKDTKTNVVEYAKNFPKRGTKTENIIFDFSKVDDQYTFEKKSVSMTDKSKDKLFEHYPSPTDIVQGEKLGDCYFLASLISIANTNPYAILNAIRDNGDGTVTIRFYYHKDDKDVFPIYYRILKTVPDSSRICAEKSALWVSLFEKAYIIHRYYTVNGVTDKHSPQEYCVLNGGYAMYSTFNITGMTVTMYFDKGEGSHPEKGYTKIQNSDELFRKIEQYKEQYSLNTSFHNIASFGGLIGRHEYSILGTKTVKYKDKVLKLIIFRNPYGIQVPEFVKKHEELRRYLEKEDRGIHKKGVFVLPIDDFFENFDFVSCNVQRPTSGF